MLNLLKIKNLCNHLETQLVQIQDSHHSEIITEQTQKPTLELQKNSKFFNLANSRRKLTFETATSKKNQSYKLYFKEKRSETQSVVRAIESTQHCTSR